MRKIYFLLALVVAVAGLVIVSSQAVSAVARRSEVGRIPASAYVQDEIVVKFKGDETFTRVRVGRGESVIGLVRAFQARSDVEYAEPNFKAFALDTPADPFYDQDNRTGDPAGYEDDKYNEQWALDNQGKTGGTTDADIDWEEAYTYLQGQSFVDAVVAVVDSGMDITHPDLNNKVYAQYSVLDGTTNVHDGYGHGTHVAGTVGSETNNLEGVIYEGVASVGFPAEIKLFPIKVLNDEGVGTNADVAEGIRYAADHGADVVNLSLGSYWDSQVVEDAVNYAWSRGLVLAAAAGNGGSGRKVYPAYYQNVISVAATNHNDQIASFSSFNDGVDVSAPGVDVLSTFPYQGSFGLQELYGRRNKYDVGTGTSMASPHVAGLAGLLFSLNPDWTNQQVRDQIESAIDDLGDMGWDKHFGHGRINVNRAVGGAGVEPTPEPTVESTPTPTPIEGEKCPPGWKKQGRC